MKRIRKPFGSIGISIGTSKEGIAEARAAVLTIMAVKASDVVLCEGLRALVALSVSPSANISNCTIRVGK